MPALYDVSIKGYSATSSSIEELQDEDALKNALKMFLMSSPGDYLGDPGRGGVLTRLINKPMSQLDRDDLEVGLRLALSAQFSPKLEIVSLSLVPDFVNRKWVFTLAYIVPDLKMSGVLKENIVGVR